MSWLSGARTPKTVAIFLHVIRHYTSSPLSEAVIFAVYSIAAKDNNDLLWCQADNVLAPVFCCRAPPLLVTEPERRLVANMLRISRTATLQFLGTEVENLGPSQRRASKAASLLKTK